jgi:hypothetical protein
MHEPRSYIVRIYRQGYRSLSGIVEDTQTGRTRAFRNTRQLSALLSGSTTSLAATRSAQAQSDASQAREHQQVLGRFEHGSRHEQPRWDAPTGLASEPLVVTGT